MNKFYIILIFLFSLTVSYDKDIQHFSERIYITSLIIQLFSLYSIFSEVSKPYSFFKIFYLFTFLFLGVAPIIQYNSQVSSYDARLLKEHEVFATNIVVILVLVLFYILYKFFYKRYKLAVEYSILLNVGRFNYKQTVILILFSCISFYAILYVNNFSILSMLFRGGSLKSEVDFSSSAFRLILEQVFRPFSMLVFLLYLSSDSKNRFVFLFLMVSAFITCSPVGVPRFYAAALYIPLLLISFSWIRKKNVFSIAIIAGLLFIFPFLDNFREYSSDRKYYFGLDFKMFKTGHFDSFQNFALIMSENIITNGRQLIGVIFFWVPRAIWTNKPIGSGELMAKKLQFEFTNVSANVFAEGYINFGYFGILIFLLIIAVITSRIDKIYWEISEKRGSTTFSILYFVMLGMFFFILRGDLLSSTAYTFGFIISYFTIIKVAGLKR